MNKIEACLALQNISKDLKVFGLENGGGGEIDVRTEIDFNIGTHYDSASIEVQVDLDEVDEYTDLKNEAEELVANARNFGERLAQIYDVLSQDAPIDKILVDKEEWHKLQRIRNAALEMVAAVRAMEVIE